MSLVGLDNNFQQMLKSDVYSVRNNLMDICATKWQTNLTNFAETAYIENL